MLLTLIPELTERRSCQLCGRDAAGFRSIANSASADEVRPEDLRRAYPVEDKRHAVGQAQWLSPSSGPK